MQKLTPNQQIILQSLKDNPNLVVYVSNSYAHLYDTELKNMVGEPFRLSTAHNLINRGLLVFSHRDATSKLSVCKLAPEPSEETP